MRTVVDTPPMLNLTRQFAIVGAIVVALATAALTFSYRHLSLDNLITEAERNNITLTRIVARQIWNTLPGYGRLFDELNPDMIRAHLDTQAVDGLLRDAIIGSAVLKLKIYDINGRVIYSSDYSQIGDDQSLNPRFRAARHRLEIVSEMVFRDRIKSYDDINTPHDVVTTYLPVLNSIGDVRAVFELYTSVTPLANSIRSQGWKLGAGFLVAALAIYLILLFAVSRWDRTLRQQYDTVHQSEDKIRQQKEELEEALRNLEDNIEALRQSEQRLTAAFHISPDLVAVTDPETGEHLDVNEAWLKTLGWRREEVIGKTAYELGVWESPAERQRVVEAFSKNNFLRNFETRLIARDGTPRNVVLSGELVKIHDKDRMMLFAHDITESKRANELLERTQDAAKVYYWRRHFNKKHLTDTSPHFSDLYETSSEDTPKTREDVFRYIHPDDKKDALTAFDIAEKEAKDFDIDFRIITAKGALKYVREFGQVERDATGAPIGHTGYIQDITALKEAEGASRAKSEFLAHMSHELRTPLNAILGFSESMHSEIMGPMENETYRDYVQNIYTSGRHLLDLINDILDVSAIEAGRAELYLQEISLHAAIASCLKLLRHRAQEKAIKIVEEIPSDDINIVADERRLKQILINILGNAIKFTPYGGEVAIALASHADGTINITISDSGPGMTPEDARIAMTPFGRASPSRTQKEEGTGLGLPLAKALTELHDGQFEMDTAPGKGVRVTIRLSDTPQEALKKAN